MSNPKKIFVIMLMVTIAAFVLRIGGLDRRPMHGDEAVHAVKFGKLLEEGVYRYDPFEYHGPTLNYLTLLPAWLSGAERLTQINEFTLRIVPVFFGTVLVLLLLFVIDGMGRAAVVCSAVATAVSPAFVFFSRYYIQEMLLVCFSFGVIVCGYRYLRGKNIYWALLAGVCFGLCHATKETFVLVFASMLFAIILTVMLQRPQDFSISRFTKIIKLPHVIAAVFTACITSALFYSSFFTNLPGVPASVRAYGSYLFRAGGSGVHDHQWYYYFKTLIHCEYMFLSISSEIVIVVLAVVGFVMAMRSRNLSKLNVGFVRFIAFYTVILAVLYSAIPYKTPWCLLGFLHGMILLAGFAAVELIRSARTFMVRCLVVLVLAAAVVWLSWQSCLGIYKYDTDPRNPYVYAHPSVDVFEMTQRIRQIAAVHPEGNDMYIQVICPGADYWPLPWYLRDFSRVGWWSHVDETSPSAPLIIASADVKSELLNKLYELPPGERNLYVPLFEQRMYLRPRIELLGFVTKDLWDNFRDSQAKLNPSGTVAEE